MSGTPGCFTSASPASSPSPFTRLNTPFGSPASSKMPAQRLAREGGELGGLQHHGASRGQRGSELPALEHERGVPRRDESRDADRLAVHVVHLRAGHLVGVVALRDDQVGEEPEVLRGALRLAERLRDRQAGVEGLELGEVGVLRLDGVGDAVQDAGSLARLHPRPRSVLERAGRGGDREVDVGLLAGGRRHVGLVGHRVEHVERVAVDAVDERAVDVVLDAVRQSLGLAHRRAPIWKSSAGVRYCLALGEVAADLREPGLGRA